MQAIIIPKRPNDQYDSYEYYECFWKDTCFTQDESGLVCSTLYRWGSEKGLKEPEPVSDKYPSDNAPTLETISGQLNNIVQEINKKISETESESDQEVSSDKTSEVTTISTTDSEARKLIGEINLIEVEDTLINKIFKQLVEDSKSQNRNDFRKWAINDVLSGFKLDGEKIKARSLESIAKGERWLTPNTNKLLLGLVKDGKDIARNRGNNR